MPTKISCSESKYVNDYVLKGRECGAKLDSHGSSIAPVSSSRKFKYKVCLHAPIFGYIARQVDRFAFISRHPEIHAQDQEAVRGKF